MPRCRYSLFLSVFFLVSCASFHAKKSPQSLDWSVYKSTNQFRQVSSFNEVDAQGQINITLHTGYKKSQVLLTGDPRDLEQVKSVVSQHTLYLVLGKGFPKHGAVHADIQGQYLTRVSYKGSGLINGSQLHTSVLDLFLANAGTTQLGGSIGLRRLDLAGNGLTQITGINSQNLQIHVVQGSPKIQLTGVISMTDLVLEGNTWLSMYWIKSDTMTIRAKKRAKILMAGTVNRLDVALWGNALFKGRYLRAQRSFIKTSGHAVAEISSINHQSTLASDSSNIYYYNLPRTREDFMAYDGSVLDMREWNRINVQDFNRYNKQFP